MLAFLHKLKAFGLSRSFPEWMVSLFSKTSFKVKVGAFLFESFEIVNNILQGISSLRHLLLLIHVNNISDMLFSVRKPSANK